MAVVIVAVLAHILVFALVSDQLGAYLGTVRVRVQMIGHHINARRVADQLLINDIIILLYYCCNHN